MPIPGADFVELWHVPPVDASGHARGALRKLRTCRNLWACPVCSSIITERRRKELQALDAAARSQGLRVVMVTLTFSHRRWDRLSDILGALLKALDRLWSGRAAEAFRRRWAMVGMVRALEVTHSELNGWHPHCHLLVYLPKEMDPKAFGGEMAERWLWALSRVGLSGDEHACRVDDTDAAITAYLAKWGHEPSWDEAAELTKQPVKRGRGAHSTPFDLLAASDAGDTRAGELFVEYVRAFYRRRQLQPTQGLYKLLLGDEAATDDELMDESEARAWLLASIRAGAWRRVPANDAVPELLQAGASGDFGRVVELVAAVGIAPRDLLSGVGDSSLV